MSDLVENPNFDCFLMRRIINDKNFGFHQTKKPYTLSTCDNYASLTATHIINGEGKIRIGHFSS